MSLANNLLAEFNREAEATKKILALVPIEKGDYKPHEKSMSLLSLATHVAEIAGWWDICLMQDELNFSAGDYKPTKIDSKEALMAAFEKGISRTNEILANVSDEKFEENWTMRNGDEIYFTMPKSEVVRTWCLNHWYHHRAQLGVYLRLLNIPLPGVYGPSADA